MPLALLENDAILKVGNVVAIEGRTVRVNVDKSKNVSHLIFNGEVVKNVSVGSYIKINKGFEILVGKIEGEFVEEDKKMYGKEYKDSRDLFKRVLRISLIGFYEMGKFKKGIKELPLVDNECFLLTNKEFSDIHHFVKGDDLPLCVGKIASEKAMKVNLGINDLFASHVGIFGNTGSGKSYTLAKIYSELFSQFKDSANFKKNAKFYLLDFNGEYADPIKEPEDDNIIVEAKYKKVYKLSTGKGGSKLKFPIPLESLRDVNMWAIFLEATEKTQTPFIRRAIESDFLDGVLADNDTFKAHVISLILDVICYNDKELDSSLVMNFLKELGQVGNSFAQNINTPIGEIQTNLFFYNKGDKYALNYKPWVFSDEPGFKTHINNYFSTTVFNVANLNEISKIRLKILLSYYSDIIKGFSNKEHLSPLIKRLDKKFDDIEKVLTVRTGEPDDSNLIIISMKDVNLTLRKVLPLFLSKYLYEQHKKLNKKECYLNLIIDEAHNILSPVSNRESETWKDYRLETFEEVIKEGRKFGVFLTIASQRPSDISTTIISQLHNYFLHRLVNNKDIEAIEKTLSYLDKVSLDSLPILPTGTCVLTGIVAQIPVVMEVDRINDKYLPSNDTIILTKFWK